MIRQTRSTDAMRDRASDIATIASDTYASLELVTAIIEQTVDMASEETLAELIDRLIEAREESRRDGR